jgi:hypothetical protein
MVSIITLRVDMPRVIIQSIILLNVIMHVVVMPSVVAPILVHKRTKEVTLIYYFPDRRRFRWTRLTQG